MAKKKKPKAKAKKFFSVMVAHTVKQFYRVQASSLKEAKQLFEDGDIEFVSKVRMLDKNIHVEEI